MARLADPLMAEGRCASAYVPLDCNTIVYRAARSASQVNYAGRKLEPAAYMLRSGEAALSVGIARSIGRTELPIEDFVQPEICGLNKVHGVATHHVGATRTLGLDVEQDEEVHANLLGLADLDEATKYHLSVALSDQSRLVWPV